MPCKPTTIDTPLTPKQRKFVETYIRTGNKERSALAAGYSKRTAAVQAHNELKKVNVWAYYQDRLNEITDKNSEALAEVISCLRDAITADVTDYIDENGNLDLKNPKFNGKLVSGIRHTRNGVDVSLLSKEKALELMGKYLGAYTERVDVTSKGESIAGPINITYEVVDGKEKTETDI